MTPGYKQTEIGVIPEDWDVSRIGQHLRRAPSYGLNAPATAFDSQLPTYLRITDITDEQRYTVAAKASVNHPAAASYLLEPGDIVFARTGASVGKSYLYDAEDGNLVFAGFLIRISPDPKSLVPGFLSFYAQSGSYWNWVKAHSQRSGQPGINAREFASLPIQIPTVVEQEAIAEALGDADALVESIRQLIAKKRQLKQGAMQELLTGRRRLPGFSEEWGIASLDSVVDRITGYWGSNESSPDSFNRAEVIRAGDISPDGQLIDTAPRFMSAAEFSRAQCRVDDTVITVSGNGLGKVWWCDGRPDVAASNFVRILRPKRNRASGRYLAYVLRSDSGLRKLHDHTATSAYPNLKPSFFAERWMLWPSIHEQQAIAALLSDIDDEMAAVETKLAKARSVKEGMMQELLTGKIRLG